MAIIAYLLWGTPHLSTLDWLQLVFWFLFPDLASFIPIGLSQNRRNWPSWGASLYDVFHTILVWGAVFVATWLASGVIYWPLAGWILHITVDRTSGYGLRARPSTKPA